MATTIVCFECQKEIAKLPEGGATVIALCSECKQKILRDVCAPGAARAEELSRGFGRRRIP